MQKKLANNNTRSYLMINNQKNDKTGTNMTLPRSVIFNSLKDAIETKEESRISELADILHSSMEYHLIHSAGISDNTARIDLQNQNIANILETIKEGFRQTDFRFKDFINQMNARFQQVDKRFEEQSQQMNARFVQVDKRFEAVDLKFENMIKNVNENFKDQNQQMNERFKEQNQQMNERFKEQNQQMNGRFKDLVIDLNGRFTEQMNSIDKRFSEADSKFRMMFWLVGIGFVSINTMIVLFKFII